MADILPPQTPAVPRGSRLPRLVLVPDHLWAAFKGTLADCGIALIDTDGERSYQLGLRSQGTDGSDHG